MLTGVEITTKKMHIWVLHPSQRDGGDLSALPHQEKTALPYARYLYCSMSSLLPSRSTGQRRWQPLACRARTSR